MKYLITALMVTSLLCGCATTKWQDTAGKGLVTIAQSVDLAMQGWVRYVQLNHIPKSDERYIKVGDYYRTYQKAFSTALNAYTASVQAKDESFFKQAETSLTASQLSLLNLLQTIKVEGN